MFAADLRTAPRPYGRREDVEAMIALADRRRKALKARAVTLGRLLLAENTGAFVRRFARCIDLARRADRLTIERVNGG